MRTSNIKNNWKRFYLWNTNANADTNTQTNKDMNTTANTNTTLPSSLSRVPSVDKIKKISKSIFNSLDCYSIYYFSSRSTVQSITRKECFARLDYIERLSVNDVSILFHYAAHNNLKDLNKRKKFVSKQNQTVRAIIHAVDIAVKVSRGEGMLSVKGESLSPPPTTTTTTSTEEKEIKDDGVGDIDALRFVAVTRIFAEWRNLRLIPKEGNGYQRYALGMSLAYRDLLQNLEKIEKGVHEYLRRYGGHHRSLLSNDKEGGTKGSSAATTTRAIIPTSPTLQQLLKFEVEMKFHKNLPYLRQKSSASGLLWTKRQLHYQLSVLSNSLQVPQLYATSKDAAKVAYGTVYNDYHGWAVKQIFSQSFNASPSLDKIWKSINPNPPQNDNYNNKCNVCTTANCTCTITSVSTRTKCSDMELRQVEDDLPRLHQLARKFSDVTSNSFGTSVSIAGTSVGACTGTIASISSQISSYLVSDSEGTIIIDDHNINTMNNNNNSNNKFFPAMKKIGADVVEKWEDLIRMFNCGRKEEKQKKHKVDLIMFNDSRFNLDQLLLDAHDDMTNNKNCSNSLNNNSIVSSTSSTTANSFSTVENDTTVLDACSLSSSSCSGSSSDSTSISSCHCHRHITAANTCTDDNSIERSKSDVKDFVRDISPIVEDLGKLIKHFNMNDPSKA